MKSCAAGHKCSICNFNYLEHMFSVHLQYQTRLFTVLVTRSVEHTLNLHNVSYVLTKNWIGVGSQASDQCSCVSISFPKYLQQLNTQHALVTFYPVSH